MSTHLSISDPRFNVREIVKQMILLEQHLLEKSKYCPDCISKHLLTIEALSDECQSLDTEGKWCAISVEIGKAAKGWATKYAAGEPPERIGQGVRALRKKLAPKVLPPDAAISNYGALGPVHIHPWIPGIALAVVLVLLARRST